LAWLFVLYNVFFFNYRIFLGYQKPNQYKAKKDEILITSFFLAYSTRFELATF